MMDWSRWRNPVSNFVNLGRLYSLSQTQKLKLDGRLPVPNARRTKGSLSHGVNLGNLFRPTRTSEYAQPRGWAYFEDGSVFFPRWSYGHNDLQQVMRIAACFVRDPSDGEITLEKKDHHQTQMILLEKKYIDPILSPGHLHMYARYAHAKENICAPLTPYCAIQLELDPTRTCPVSTVFYSPSHRRLTFPNSNFMSIKNVLRSARTFRGTLVDGILQPNVRLGNGLGFSVKPLTAHNAPPQAARVAQKKANLYRKETQEQHTVRTSREVKRQQHTPQQEQRSSAASPEETQRLTRKHRSIGLDFTRTRKESSDKISIMTPYDPNQRQENWRLRGLSTTDTESRAAQLEEPERKPKEREDTYRRKRKGRQLEQEQAEARTKLQSEAYDKTAIRERPAADAFKSKLVSTHQANDVLVIAARPQTPPAVIRTTQARPERRQRYGPDSSNVFEEREAPEKETREPEAKAQAESISEFLNHDDTMPTEALDLLRKASRKH